MAYDFSNIYKMTIDGKEATKITKSNGSIVWQKTYVWKKYSADSVFIGYTESKSSTTLTPPSSGDLCQSYTFDSTTGKFSLSGEVASAKFSSTYGTLYGWELYAALPSIITNNFSDYVYTIINGTLYQVRSWTKDSSGKLSVYKYSATAKYNYSQGSTYYGTITSTSSSTYPANGVSGNYWYVRQS